MKEGRLLTSHARFFIEMSTSKCSKFSNFLSTGYKEELDKINDIIIYIDSYEGDELDIRTLVEAFKIKIG